MWVHISRWGGSDLPVKVSGTRGTYCGHYADNGHRNEPTTLAGQDCARDVLDAGKNEGTGPCVVEAEVADDCCALAADDF